jgi:hypothetical protein
MVRCMSPVVVPQTDITGAHYQPKATTNVRHVI